MNKARFVDADEFEQITVNALDEALNALEILNEVYVKDELDFVNQAIAKVKEALCLLPIPEEMQ